MVIIADHHYELICVAKPAETIQTKSLYKNIVHCNEKMKDKQTEMTQNLEA